MADNEQLARLVQGDHTDAVEAFENRIVDQAAGSVDADFTALVRRTVVAWTRAFGSPDAEASNPSLLRRILTAVRAAIRRILQGVGIRAQQTMEDSLTDAVMLGARQGSQWLRQAAGERHDPLPTRPSRGLRGATARITAAVDERRDRSLAMLRPARARRWSAVASAIGTARGAVASIRTNVTWVVNQAVNEGLIAGIRAVGARKLWIAERDACVRCAAYAGHVVDVGDDFPGGLSFDPTQRGRGNDLPAPPLHPHCRCRVVAWKDSWAVEGVLSLPDSLRREARRSVARGWSLPSETNAARIRAARELLRTGAGLPKSVAEFAATAVRAGRFANRSVPTA
ncbi:hypothetical protein ACWEAF_05740 [Streptomyces sp. NPDC005071]